MHRFVAHAIVAIVGLSGGLPPVMEAEAQLAIVVNRASRVEDVSLDQVRRLYLGQSQSLPGGGTVALVVFTPAQPTFAERTLGLPEKNVRQRWIGIVYRGEAPTPPVEIADVEQVKQYVRSHPNALAFLPLAAIDATIKVLRVDGRTPGDAGYPVR